MLLSFLLIIPFLSAFFSVFSYRLNDNLPRWMALIGIILTLLILMQVFFNEYDIFFQYRNNLNWNHQFTVSWIPKFGINFSIQIDGFSMLMLLFASFLSIIAILCAWNEIKKNEGLFYFNFMLVFTSIIGVFLSADLFLFFCFWEIILIPTYFLVLLWSDEIHTKKRYIAANKFLIYGQISGLILLLSILLLVLSYYQHTNILTFSYNTLLTQSIDKTIEYAVMLGFFLAFSIKMPIVPFHGWLSDIHTKSSYCAAVEIISVLLKISPYALLRYNLMLFPYSTKQFIPIAICFGIISMFYGAWIAFSQTNTKKFIAYSSLSHMGLILIGIYSNSEIALQAVIIHILSNSLSTAALCILFGQLYKYLKTQNVLEMGGLWSCFYWIPGFTLFFALANLGIPGTGNFVGEFLILYGIFQTFPFLCMLCTIGMIFSSIYSLNIIHKIFYGSRENNMHNFYPNKKIIISIIILMIASLFLGINPQVIMNISYPAIHNIYKTL